MSKYIYKGNSLYGYCKKNKQSYYTIVKYIKRLKLSEEYKYLSDDNLCEMAVNYYEKSIVNDSINDKVRYYYKGDLLINYCKENNIKYISVVKKINRMKKKNPNLSDEEIIEECINYNYNKAKYHYKGETLYSYCIRNDIYYNSLIQKIKNIKSMDKYSSKSEDEIIEMAMGKTTSIYRFFYKGMPLKEYCLNNGICYPKVLKKLKDMKTIEKFNNINQDTLIEMAMEESKVNKNIKYYYQGITLVQYCKENNLSIYTIEKKLKEYQKKDEYINMSNDELIKMIIDEIKKSKSKYTYKGISLSEYCRKNNLNYSNVLIHINKLKKAHQFQEESMEETIEKIIDNIRKSEKYYQGIPLKEYCRINNIFYPTLTLIIKRLNKKNPNMNEEDLIEKAIKSATKKSKRASYMYKGMLFSKYCDKENINYDRILYQVNKLKLNKGNKSLSIEELLDLALSKYKLTSEDYTYKGMRLKEYCRENKIAYTTVIKRINTFKRQKDYKNYKEEDLIYFAISGYDYCAYHYRGRPFNVFCKENNLDYLRMMQRYYFLKRNKKYSNYTKEELLNMAVNIEYRKKCDYLINGVSLKDYCDQNDLNFKLIMSKIRILEKKREYKNSDFDVIIKEAIKAINNGKNHKI